MLTDQARARAAELGVADRLTFVHGDTAGHVADEPVDVAACLGTTWINDGVAGTAQLLGPSLRPSGQTLIGEPCPDSQVGAVQPAFDTHHPVAVAMHGQDGVRVGTER
ncbi:hypothetical protein [Nocardiopsis salina]|uniref:hypothetical protein n=1 Tax=Nocardiopsis salina TaxID=245836 RepID=UPI00034A0529|nr:hypothetical protein [Nocardiopsis salina]